MDKILSPIKGRIIHFIENQHIKKQDFYKKTDLAASNFKGLGAKSELGGDGIVKILSAYPQINSEWLLTGAGPMCKSYMSQIPGQNIVNESAGGYTKIKSVIPLLPALAIGGVNGFEVSIQSHDIEAHFDIPVLPEKADFALQVSGDSMHPYIENRSYVVCKKITIDQLEWEKVYLVLVNHAPMIKRLYPSTNKDYILLRSDNQQYRDFEVAKSDITGIAKIVGKIALF